MVAGTAVCVGLAIAVRSENKVVGIVRMVTPILLLALVVSPWMMEIPHHTGHGTKYIDLSCELFFRIVVCLLVCAAVTVLLRDRRVSVIVLSGITLVLYLFAAGVLAKYLWKTNRHIRELRTRTIASTITQVPLPLHLRT
jgi:hypothetical protein